MVLREPLTRAKHGCRVPLLRADFNATVPTYYQVSSHATSGNVVELRLIFYGSICLRSLSLDLQIFAWKFFYLVNSYFNAKMLTLLNLKRNCLECFSKRVFYVLNMMKKQVSQCQNIKNFFYKVTKQWCFWDKNPRNKDSIYHWVEPHRIASEIDNQTGAKFKVDRYIFGTKRS